MRRSIFVPFAILMVASTGETEQRRSELETGFSIPQVIQRWGEPTEKSELEVKRREVWRYPNGAYVVFSEGKVADWRMTDAETARRELLASAADSAEADIDAASVTDTRDLVREIAKEVPSGPDLPDSEPAPAASGTNLMPEQNNLGISPGVQVIPEGSE